MKAGQRKTLTAVARPHVENMHASLYRGGCFSDVFRGGRYRPRSPFFLTGRARSWCSTVVRGAHVVTSLMLLRDII